jgi:DNA-binding transcriptional MerR regulator
VNSESSLLTIGQLAAAVGVPDSTIRYWERQNLVAPTAWRGGQRRYAPDVITQLKVLRLCQEVGFSLEEVRYLGEQRVADASAWRGLLRGKITDLGRRMTRLKYARGLLEHAVHCDHEDILTCPRFLEWLERHEAVDDRRARGRRCPFPRSGDARPNARADVSRH